MASTPPFAHRTGPHALPWLEAPLRQAVAALVRGYRFFLSPWLGSSCRFEPTCSRYMLDALQHHGAWRGLRLGTWRILRCHPWCDGGLDPVPGTSPAAGLFTALTPGADKAPALRKPLP